MIAAVFLLACLLQLSTARNVVHMEQDPVVDGPKQNGQLYGFAFAIYYNSHMVLQQAPKRAVIWGIHPKVGQTITLVVSKLPKKYTTVVKPGPDANTGVWSVTLDPVASGGPYEIQASCDDWGVIKISDVLFGDVWVCSGQSNMQFSTDQIFNATKELNESSQYTDIRLFTAAMRFSVVPLYDLEAVAEPWSLPSPSTVGKSPFNYFSAVCWLFGKRLYKELGYPIGLIDTSWGGTPVEAWSSPQALAKCGISQDDPSSFRDVDSSRDYTRLEGPSQYCVLWNAMVYPLLNMTIYGAIWYQGEADAREPRMHRYNCTFPAMIDDWRQQFSASSQQTSPDFPFGFVQLAANGPDHTPDVGFPDIRWHQTADYGYVPNDRMRNVFMAVSMDLPDFASPWGSVHPRDKQDVAQRLFNSGMRVAYGRGASLVDGPRPKAVVQSGDRLTVTYAAGTQDTIRLASREGFELCCSFTGVDECSAKNAWWLPSPVLANNQSSLVLDATVCGPGQFIAGMRYAWRVSPCVFKHCAVYSTISDLPAPAFITVKPSTAGADFTYVIDWSKPQVIVP